MIDSKLQEELREKYNPDGSLLRRHQLRMLEILKYVDGICRENNINYWLSSGTCLGAVRHGGFIPWDDDADIEMLREDYLKLEKILKKETKYDFQTWRTDPYYVAPYAKLRDKKSKIKERSIVDIDYRFHGAYIDIFPMEPSNSSIISKVGKFLYLACYIGNLFKIRWLKFLYRKIAYFIAFQLIAPPLRFISSICATGRLRGRLGFQWQSVRYIGEIFPLQTMSFEGYDFFVPGNTDAYLKRLYRDYMAFPKNKTGHLAD